MWSPLDRLGTNVRGHAQLHPNPERSGGRPQMKNGHKVRIAEDGNAFRVMYVAKFGDRIHVLHCFQTKTQATPKKDVSVNVHSCSFV